MSEEQNVDLTFREAITELGQIVEALESTSSSLRKASSNTSEELCLSAFCVVAWKTPSSALMC